MTSSTDSKNQATSASKEASTASTSSVARVLNVGDVAAPFKADLIRIIKEQNIAVKLVGFLANADPSAERYALWTGKSCEATGIQFELRRVNREQLEDTIIEANEDSDVHGIMVYYPVFGGGHDQYIQNCVSPFKDVEGLCHKYRFNMYHNIRFVDHGHTLKSIVPCTPLAILKILEHLRIYDTDIPYGNQLFGKTVTIINRSEVVGRPLAALLANDGAMVYSVDINDILIFIREGERKHKVCETKKNLEDVLKVSDVVITGVPNPNYKVNTKLLRQGVIAINFSSEKNFEDEINEVASVLVNTIGRVTVTMLERNLLRLRRSQLLRAKSHESSKRSSIESLTGTTPAIPGKGAVPLVSRQSSNSSVE